MKICPPKPIKLVDFSEQIGIFHPFGFMMPRVPECPWELAMIFIARLNIREKKNINHYINHAFLGHQLSPQLDFTGFKSGIKLLCLTA